MSRRLVILACALAPSAAVADADERRQLATADAASVGLVVSGLVVHRVLGEHPAGEVTALALTGAGVVGLSVAAPAIHAANGRVGRAIASYALRDGLPAIAAAIVFARTAPWDCGEDPRHCVDETMMWSAVIGAHLAGAAIDYAISGGRGPAPRVISLAAQF